MGTTADAGKENCLAFTRLPCDFTQANYTKCQVVGNEGFTYNIFQEQKMQQQCLDIVKYKEGQINFRRQRRQSKQSCLFGV